MYSFLLWFDFKTTNQCQEMVLFYPLALCERPKAIALSFLLVKVQSKQKNFNALAKYPQTTKISITGFSTIFLYCHSGLKTERIQNK